MLREEFKTWRVDPIPDATLFALGIHVTNLGYLENRAFRVTELPDGSTKELDLGLGLDHAAAIPDNDNQPPPDLSNLKAERAKKKVEKARRRQQKKSTLA